MSSGRWRTPQSRWKTETGAQLSSRTLIQWSEKPQRALNQPVQTTSAWSSWLMAYGTRTLTPPPPQANVSFCDLSGTSSRVRIDNCTLRWWAHRARCCRPQMCLRGGSTREGQCGGWVSLQPAGRPWELCWFMQRNVPAVTSWGLSFVTPVPGHPHAELQEFMYLTQRGTRAPAWTWAQGSFVATALGGGPKRWFWQSDYIYGL